MATRTPRNYVRDLVVALAALVVGCVLLVVLATSASAQDDGECDELSYSEAVLEGCDVDDREPDDDDDADSGDDDSDDDALTDDADGGFVGIDRRTRGLRKPYEGDVGLSDVVDEDTEASGDGDEAAEETDAGAGGQDDPETAADDDPNNLGTVDDAADGDTTETAEGADPALDSSTGGLSPLWWLIIAALALAAAAAFFSWFKTRGDDDDGAAQPQPLDGSLVFAPEEQPGPMIDHAGTATTASAPPPVQPIVERPAPQAVQPAPPPAQPQAPPAQPQAPPPAVPPGPTHIEMPPKPPTPPEQPPDPTA